MFYKFNSFVGRLMPATQAEAYSPQGLSPKVREPSRIMFDSKKTKAAVDGLTPLRSSSSKSPLCKPTEELGVVPENSRYKRIMELQCHFLKNDGLLVWQKMGTRDTILFATTLGVGVIGAITMGNMLINMIFPKNQCK